MCERCSVSRLCFTVNIDSDTGYVFSYFSVGLFLLLLIDQGMYPSLLLNYLYYNYWYNTILAINKVVIKIRKLVRYDIFWWYVILLSR